MKRVRYAAFALLPLAAFTACSDAPSPQSASPTEPASTYPLRRDDPRAKVPSWVRDVPPLARMVVNEEAASRGDAIMLPPAPTPAEHTVVQPPSYGVLGPNAPHATGRTSEALIPASGDDRVPIADTTVWPYRTRVKLYLTGFPGVNGNGASTQCSGTMIDRRHVLTAAHCLYNTEATGGLNGAATGGLAIPAMEEDYAPFGVANIIGVHADGNYDGHTGGYADFGVVTLDLQLGDVTGYTQPTFNPVNAAGQSAFTRQGYPVDKAYGRWLYGETSVITGTNLLAGILTSTVNSAGHGDSGSGLVQVGTDTVFAIDSFESSAGYNAFTWLLPASINVINNWIAYDDAHVAPTEFVLGIPDFSPPWGKLGGTTSAQPVVGSFDDVNDYAYTLGNDNVLYYQLLPAGSPSANPVWTPLNGKFSHPPSVTLHNGWGTNQLLLTGRGMDGRVWYGYNLNGTHTDFAMVPNSPVVWGAPVAFSPDGKIIMVFALDAVGGNVMYARWSPTYQWSPWQNLGGTGTNPVPPHSSTGAIGTPAIAGPLADGTIRVYTTGFDGHIYRYGIGIGNDWLTLTPGWKDVSGFAGVGGPVIVSRPLAFARDLGAIDVFALDQGGNVQQIHDPLSGPQLFPNTIACCFRGELSGVLQRGVLAPQVPRIDLVGVGRDNALYAGGWTGGAWNYTGIGGEFFLPPSLAYSAWNTLVMVGKGADSHVYSRRAKVADIW